MSSNPYFTMTQNMDGITRIDFKSDSPVKLLALIFDEPLHSSYMCSLAEPICFKDDGKFKIILRVEARIYKKYSDFVGFSGLDLVADPVKKYGSLEKSENALARKLLYMGCANSELTSQFLANF